MQDDKTGDNLKPTGRSSVFKRRSFVRSLGAGALGSALLGGSTPSVGAVSDDGVNSSISIQQRAFDPIWYSPVENYWEGTTRTDTTGEEYEGAILVRGALTLNEIREGDHDNMFSFNLFTFGISASEGIPESNLEDEIGPVEVMHSDHTMRVETDDFDARDITTNYPRIGAELGRTNTSVNSDLFQEIPDRQYEWTSGEQDLKSADTDLPSNDESLMLGGASIATGAAALVPGVNVGVATLLSGTSIVFGLAGMVESMDEQGEQQTHTQDKWEYTATESTDSFWGGGSVSDVSVFSHNLIIDIPVEHYSSATVDITDEISHNDNGIAVPYQDDELPWMSNNGTLEWTVDIPAYSSTEDPEDNPPTVIGGPEESL